MQIRQEDPTRREIVALLGEHLTEMRAITPPGSVHALDLDALRSPDLTLWSAWEEGALLGCGALLELDPHTGEVKSMRTASAHRRQGVAAKILEHILAEARRRGYQHLHLETGSSPAFAPARALYTRYGFETRGPFGGYADDPHSSFMTKRL